MRRPTRFGMVLVSTSAALLLTLTACSNNNTNNNQTKPSAATVVATRAATIIPSATQASGVTVTATATTPPASTAASPVSGHTWYTSSESNAKLYYCDDDSQWQTLSKTALRTFLTAAALTKAYPSRTLHQPCADGTTGP